MNGPPPLSDQDMYLISVAELNNMLESKHARKQKEAAKIRSEAKRIKMVIIAHIKDRIEKMAEIAKAGHQAPDIDIKNCLLDHLFHELKHLVSSC